MKVDKVVRKETLNIAVGILAWSAITQVVFFVLGKYSLAVLLGSVYGGGVALLNFFLMGLTVQSVTKMEDPNKAKRKMQSSYHSRQMLLLLLVGGGFYIAANFEVFHWLPIILAVFYPRLTIVVGRFFRKDWRSERGDVA